MALLNRGPWLPWEWPGLDPPAPDVASTAGAAAAEGFGRFGDGSPPSVAATQLRSGWFFFGPWQPWQLLPQKCGDLSVTIGYNMIQVRFKASFDDGCC